MGAQKGPGFRARCGIQVAELGQASSLLPAWLDRVTSSHSMHSCCSQAADQSVLNLACGALPGQNCPSYASLAKCLAFQHCTSSPLPKGLPSTLLSASSTQPNCLYCKASLAFSLDVTPSFGGPHDSSLLSHTARP